MNISNKQQINHTQITLENIYQIYAENSENLFINSPQIFEQFQITGISTIRYIFLDQLQENEINSIVQTLLHFECLIEFEFQNLDLCNFPMHILQLKTKTLRIVKCNIFEANGNPINLLQVENLSFKNLKLVENQVEKLCQEISKNKNIQQLSFENCEIDDLSLDNILNVVEKNKKIIKISLEKNNISCFGFSKLQNLVEKNPQIQKLKISQNLIFMAPQIKIQDSFFKIQKIDFSYCGITQDFFYEFITIIKNSNNFLSNCQSLKLNNNIISNKGVQQFFKYINSFPKLLQLGLRNTQMCDSSIDIFIKNLPNSKLQKIDFSSNFISSIGCMKIIQSVEQSELIDINLSSNYIGKYYCQLFEEKFNSKKLQIQSQKKINKIQEILNFEKFFNEFEYINKKISEQWYQYIDGKMINNNEPLEELMEVVNGIAASNSENIPLQLSINNVVIDNLDSLMIKQIIQLVPTITSIIFKNCNFSDSTLDDTFKIFVINTNIIHINLSQNLIQQKSLGTILKYISLSKKVFDIDFENNLIDDTGFVEILNNLQKVPTNLNTLKLKNNKITNQSVQLLAQNLQNNQIRINQINLDENIISPKAIENLLESIIQYGSQINIISLNNLQLTDVEAYKIKQLIDFKQIISLSLNFNNFTDHGGGLILNSFIQSKSMQELYMYNNQFTDEFIKDSIIFIDNKKIQLQNPHDCSQISANFHLTDQSNHEFSQIANFLTLDGGCKQEAGETTRRLLAQLAISDQIYEVNQLKETFHPVEYQSPKSGLLSYRGSESSQTLRIASKMSTPMSIRNISYEVEKIRQTSESSSSLSQSFGEEGCDERQFQQYYESRTPQVNQFETPKKQPFKKKKISEWKKELTQAQQQPQLKLSTSRSEKKSNFDDIEIIKQQIQALKLHAQKLENYVNSEKFGQNSSNNSLNQRLLQDIQQEMEEVNKKSLIFDSVVIEKQGFEDIKQQIQLLQNVGKI